MATYSVDMMRRDLNREYHFLNELEQAFQVLQDLGYDRSSDPEDREKYRELAVKVGDQRHRIHYAEELLRRSAR